MKLNKEGHKVKNKNLLTSTTSSILNFIYLPLTKILDIFSVKKNYLLNGKSRLAVK